MIGSPGSSRLPFLGLTDLNKTFLKALLGACAAVVIGSPTLVHAQAGKGMTSIVVPQPAGNPTDGVARKLQPLLQKELGQTVLVENFPGAGGSIGTQKVLNAATDGSSILVASQTEPILTPFTLRHVKYKPEELRVIALASRLPYVLVGRTSLPAQNLAELISHAKKQGGASLNLGHIGPGSMIHLLGEQWARKSGLQINHVSYKGVPPLAQDLMGGQIDLTFLPLGGNVLSLIESGKIKAFATTAATSSASLPKVPALSASDKSMSDFVYGTWIAFLVPAKTPDAVVSRLTRAFTAAMQDQDFQAYVTSTGMELANVNSIDELNKFYLAETRLYQGLARTIGVEPN